MHKVFENVTRELEKGHSSPLKKKGMIWGTSEQTNPNSQNNYDIDSLNFQCCRIDNQRTVNPTYLTTQLIGQGGSMQGKIVLSNGSEVNSRKPGADTIGRYFPPKGKDGHIWGSNVTMIYVSNGTEGTIGLKIPFGDLKQDLPIVIISGALSGCFMTYAVDAKNFYAYHTGRPSADNDDMKGWRTGQDGIQTVFQAQRALKEQNTQSKPQNTYNSLPQIFSNYNKAIATYKGQQGNIITAANDNKFASFNYDEAQSTGKVRVGYSYALLVKTNNGIVAKVVSEDCKVKLRSKKIKVLNSLYDALTK